MADPVEAPKSILASKTMWLAVVTGAAGVVGAFVPSVQSWVAANANTILMALGAVSAVLRYVTKGRVVLFASDN